MPTDPPIQVYAAPEFQRKLRGLAKEYRQIYTDVQPVLEQLQQANDFLVWVVKFSAAKLCRTALLGGSKLDPNRDCKELGISTNWAKGF